MALCKSQHWLGTMGTAKASLKASTNSLNGSVHVCMCRQVLAAQSKNECFVAEVYLGSRSSIY